MQTVLLFAAFAGLSAPAQPGAHSAPVVEARAHGTASIRIIRPARIDAHAAAHGVSGAQVETRTLVEPDGLTRRATLVEFE